MLPTGFRIFISFRFFTLFSFLFFFFCFVSFLTILFSFFFFCVSFFSFLFVAFLFVFFSFFFLSVSFRFFSFFFRFSVYRYPITLQCKIQKNWCTVTVALAIEHHITYNVIGTSACLETLFYIKQYGPYSHFGYCTLISEHSSSTSMNNMNNSTQNSSCKEKVYSMHSVFFMLKMASSLTKLFLHHRH